MLGSVCYAGSMPKTITYLTTANSVREGFTILREDGRKVTVERAYMLGDQVYIRDNSGTPGTTYSPAEPITVLSDN